MAFTISLGLASCSESSEMGDGKYNVSLSAHKLQISSSGSTTLKTLTDDDNNFAGYELSETSGFEKTYTLAVDAENTPWQITGMPSWITISPASGTASEDVTVKIGANSPTQTEREAKLTFASTDPEWEYSIPITVKQVEASPEISKKKYLTDFGSDSQTQDCQFSANFLPAITYEDNDTKWISASIEKATGDYYNMPLYTMHVTVAKNEETTSRYGYILLQFNGKTIDKYEVSQRGFYASSSVSNSYFYIDSKGETKEITYTANFTPTIQYDEIKSWCKASIDTGKKTIMLTVEPNETESTRSGYLYLMYNGKKQQSVNIYQYAFSATASFGSSYIYADKKGTTEAVSYTANFIPTLKYDEVKDWCDVTINKSSKTITVKVKANATGRTRSGYIYLMYNGKNKASLRIYQEG